MKVIPPSWPDHVGAKQEQEKTTRDRPEDGRAKAETGGDFKSHAHDGSEEQEADGESQTEEEKAGGAFKSHTRNEEAAKADGGGQNAGKRIGQTLWLMVC